MNKSLDNHITFKENVTMNRKVRRHSQSVVARIVKRSPHLSPEEVAAAAARIIHG